MNIGNNMFGLNICEDYFSIYLFPFGFEILIIKGIEIAFVVFGLELTITIKENNTLFRND